MIKNQEPHSQIENDETPGPEYSNENDSGDTEPNKASAIAHFMSNISPDHDMESKIFSKIESKIFSIICSRTKDYVKLNGHNVKPVHIFR